MKFYIVLAICVFLQGSNAEWGGRYDDSDEDGINESLEQDVLKEWGLGKEDNSVSRDLDNSVETEQEQNARIEGICQMIQFDMTDRNNPKLQRIRAVMARLPMSRRRAIIGLVSERKRTITACCQQDWPEKKTCIHRIQMQRYDRVCAQEEPLYLWSMVRGQSSRTNTIMNTCCASTGESRYNCFLREHGFDERDWPSSA